LTHLLKISSILLFIIVSLVNLNAQTGNYIKGYGILQLTNIANRNDFYAYNQQIKYETSSHTAYGLNYVFNGTDIFGIELGFRYATTGQKYSGSVDDDGNTSDSADGLNFNSELKLSYFQVPLLLCFNSRMEEDNVFLTISAGIQLDFLNGVDMTVKPYPLIPAGGEIDVKELFRKTNISFLTNAAFNIRLSEKLFLNTGFQMYRTIGDIENKTYQYPANTVLEYYFPVSTKKERKTDHSTRPSTKNISYGFSLGISYMFKSID